MTTIHAAVASPEAIKAKVAKFNAQLERWGLGEGAATVMFPGTSYLAPLNELAGAIAGCEGAEHFPGTEFIRLYDAVLTFEPVKLPGDFVLAAVVAHSGSTNIVNRCPSFDGKLAEDLWTAEPTCDHCGYNRERNETILVYSAAEGYKRVGTTCVRPYLGVDGKHLLSWSLGMASLLDEDERERSSAACFLTSDYVAAAAALILASGFKPSSFADSTRSGAYALLADHSVIASPEAIDLANKAIAWAKALPLTGDFERNMVAAAGNELLDKAGRSAGVLAYIPEGYLRAEAKRIELASVANVNEHVGNVGDKIMVTLTITRLIQSEGYTYNGPDALRINGKDADGHLFSVKTSVGTAIANAAVNADEGATLTLTGTVKAHSEWNDRKTTDLTRCKPA
jgi:hypothetical protein